MGALAEAGKHTYSVLPAEREGALAAIASARRDYEHVAIRPRRPWRGDTSRAVELKPPNHSNELDCALDAAMERYPRDKYWEVIGARAIASHSEEDDGDWPAEFELYADADVISEFRVCLF